MELLFSRSRRTRREWQEADRLELLRGLIRHRCLVCREKDATERHWCNWYVLETHTDPAYRKRVADEGGFCARHVRLLMESSESRRLLPRLFGDVIVRQLAQPADLAGRTVRCDPCGKMAWTERVQIDTIVKWITDSEIRAALVSAGKLCIPHLLDVMSAVPWALVAELSSMAIDQLAESTAEDLITILAPSDPDLSRCAPHLPSANDIRLQSDKLTSTQSTLDHVLSGVERACCSEAYSGT